MSWQDLGEVLPGEPRSHFFVTATSAFGNVVYWPDCQLSNKEHYSMCAMFFVLRIQGHFGPSLEAS